MKKKNKQKTFSTCPGKYANDNKIETKICMFSKYIVYLKRLQNFMEWNEIIRNKIWKILTTQVAIQEAISLPNNYSVGFQAKIIQFNWE